MRTLIFIGALLSAPVLAQCDTTKVFTWYELASIESIENQAAATERMVSSKRIDNKNYVIYASRINNKLDIVVRYDDTFLRLNRNNCDPYSLGDYALSSTEGALFLGIEKK